jgi:hypothetical protein
VKKIIRSEKLKEKIKGLKKLTQFLIDINVRNSTGFLVSVGSIQECAVMLTDEEKR